MSQKLRVVVVALVAILIAVGIPFGITAGINMAKENYKRGIQNQYIEINKRYSDESFSLDIGSYEAAKQAEARTYEYFELTKKLVDENEHEWHSFLTRGIVKGTSRNMYQVYCALQYSSATNWLLIHDESIPEGWRKEYEMATANNPITGSQFDYYFLYCLR